MKNIILPILSAMILTQSCNNPNNQQETVTIDTTSATIIVDTVPKVSNNEEIITVDTAKYIEKKLTKEEEKRQNKIFDDFFGPKFYKIGAKPSVIIKVEGQPTRVIVIGPYKTFYYGGNSLTFYNDRLQEYNNADGSLKVRIEE